MSYDNYVPFSTLVGKTLTSIEGAEVGLDEITFTTSDGERFRMYHDQDCCESVDIEDISGDVQDLIGHPITVAEESEGARPADRPKDPDDRYDDSETWTFYRLATERGFVVFRWYGTSNGYYSESVSFEKLA